MKRKIAIIDSSVLLSLYLKDNLHVHSKNLTRELQDTHDLLIPDIVFCEVINVLFREGLKEDAINKIILKLSNLEGKIVHLDAYYWKFHFLNLVKKIRLKSNDFMILSFVYYFDPDLFLTFDKRLKNAYNLMIAYEENSQ